MDFRLSPEEEAMSQFAYELATGKFAANAFTWEEKEYPWENARILAEHGLLGMVLSEENGGGGRPMIEGILAMEQITRICPHTGDIVQAANFGPIRSVDLSMEDKKLKREVIEAVISGEHTISQAMTEPEAGSAVTDLRTTAVEKGDGFVIRGRKVFSGHADVSTYFQVYCRFEDGKIGSVLMKRGMDGFNIGLPQKYMSGAHYCELTFDDVFVPKNHVITHDFRKLMGAMNVERCGNASRCVGVAQAAFDRVLQYVQERKQFGRYLYEFQGIQWKLADMYRRLEAARWLVYRAVVNAGMGVSAPMESSLAKIEANEMVQYVTNEALQIFGAYGYSKELPLEYLYRRGRGWAIGGGTLEMQRTRVAASLLGKKISQRPEKPRRQQGEE
ncbi:acyl-CoA dehydrogenase family protein [Paradesulfitobacterium ferrireducens]|uniref:acyl-CoA dehydrogenase family protein n=1 Tax=Paradesulfitobacterium ferrireducens TaxID=2816476 RepID=UPI001A9094A8|nr:acyl-CoA dehydrogenase family protein [Paradesulfitobacterium ferrireducens]